MEIWEDILLDEERGARRLVDEFGGKLFGVAMCLTADPVAAEDLVFRTCERIVRKIKQFDPAGSFSGWAYQTLVNFHRMDMRKRRPTVLSSGNLLDLEAYFADDAEEHAQAAPSITSVDEESVRLAVAELPQQLREVVLARYFVGQSLEEIAAALSVPIGTVKSRLHAARETLRELLNPDGTKR